ncbi:hypothetical protein PF002_g1847 [Phytophthora fragariae]|uniref:Uncharacterized protein n=3 Tax=Phytophthora fragariae TaxID=53985 RepID=A0A6A4AFE0_9STRA|nr:hypothetical protein PF011_g28657 [Phytophthora fragariae]KAE9256468.1 hypothetical protein PF002_g1847 [Phytophthora fragariae]
MPYETVASIPTNDYYDDEAACDKESTPEPDHDQVKNPEVDACILQAASVMTRAASVMTACDKMSTPVSDHDYEEKLEVDVCTQQATPFTTARDLESAPEPDPDCDPTLLPNARATQAASETSARGEAFAPEPAAVRPDEAFLPDDRPDRSVNAVRVLFQRPSCEPDPNRTVIYESFGMKPGWGPARAAESNPAPVTPAKPPESPPPLVEAPREEGIDEPERVPKRADPDDMKTAAPHARVFTAGELDALENGEPSAVADEKEEYEKESEELLFPLDEIELQRRMKTNAEQQKELSLSELSALLDIPEEKLTRTRDSSPGVLSSPEYWLQWYKETLATSEAAKRANRDFRSAPEDENHAPTVTSVRDEAVIERFTEVGGDSSRTTRTETSKSTVVNE